MENFTGSNTWTDPLVLHKQWNKGRRFGARSVRSL